MRVSNYIPAKLIVNFKWELFLHGCGSGRFSRVWLPTGVICPAATGHCGIVEAEFFRPAFALDFAGLSRY